MTIHKFGSYYRVLEFKGKFLPQYTLNGNQWHYFHENHMHVEFVSLVVAEYYINSTAQEVISFPSSQK